MSIGLLNSEGTVLAINPNADLEYASGADPDAVSAKRYSYLLSTLAADTEGNALAASVVVTFATLRRIRQQLARVPERTDSLLASGLVHDGNKGTAMFVGDTEEDEPVKGLVTIDVEPLPEAIVSFTSAKLAAGQSATYGVPYQDLGGPLALQHVSFTALDAGAFAATPLASALAFSVDAELERKSADVWAELEDDYEHRQERANQSQYRLEFPAASDSDGGVDIAEIAVSTLSLDVEYLIE